MSGTLIESLPQFKLSMQLEGPERTEETRFGPREHRDSLARFDVEVSGHKAWRIFQEALAKIVEQEAIITFPESITAEEAERIREEWTKRRG